MAEAGGVCHVGEVSVESQDGVSVFFGVTCRGEGELIDDGGHVGDAHMAFGTFPKAVLDVAAFGPSQSSEPKKSMVAKPKTAYSSPRQNFRAYPNF